MTNMMTNKLITKQLIKPWKPCASLLSCIWGVLFFERRKLNLSPRLVPIFSKASRGRLIWVSYPTSLDLQLWYVVETCAINTSWKRCQLVISCCLIHGYFTSQESFLLISAEIRKFKVTHFSRKNYFAISNCC